MDYRFPTKGVTEIFQDGADTIVRTKEGIAPSSKPTIGAGPQNHTPSDGVYLVSPPGQEPYLQGGDFLEHGPPVRVNEQGFPVDATGRVAGANVSGETMTQLITSKIVTYKGKSYTGYGYEIKGQAGGGSPGSSSAAIASYTVNEGGSFDIPMPSKAVGQRKIQLNAPTHFDLTFMIPGDEPDSPNGGTVAVFSEASPDNFAADVEVLGIVPSQRYAGQFYFPFRVGVEGGDGIPVLSRGQTVTLRFVNHGGSVMQVDVARPSRYV